MMDDVVDALRTVLASNRGASSKLHGLLKERAEILQKELVAAENTVAIHRLQGKLSDLHLLLQAFE